MSPVSQLALSDFDSNFLGESQGLATIVGITGLVSLIVVVHAAFLVLEQDATVQSRKQNRNWLHLG